MTEDENDEVTKLPPDARLESLDKRLDRAQRREAEGAKNGQVDPNMRVTQLVIGYLIGGPLGGGLLGWGLDSLFGTRPWLMLVMLFLGFGVGVRSILRIAKIPPGHSPGDGL
jgi:ATP synthase protein I